MASASQCGDAQLRIAPMHDKEQVAEIVTRAYAVEEFFVA